MLKTVEYSRATKTRGIAVTYRAGERDIYGTCPTSCEMNCSGKGSQKIDPDYFAALLDAVPRRGVSFTYTHFAWHLWADRSDKDSTGQTVVNFSAKTLLSAAAASRVVPAVVVLPATEWIKGKYTSAPLLGGTNNRGDFIQTDAVRVVRCPAEYKENFSCGDCGSGAPLCARADRDYIIGFTAHGASKRKAADPETSGGCYADGGHVRLHWDATAKSDQDDETDADKLRRFAKGLKSGSIIRHHVAGDIG
jgi:hypothetical protein|tara:strand:+ start:972 stop:1721 length:750 start_codon:yes stop_codon:yes gene_type:complete